MITRVVLRPFVVGIAVLGSLVAGPAVGAGAGQVTYSDLGVLGGLDSTAWAVSAHRVVVGHADTSAGSGWHGFHAYRWTATGGMVDLGTLRGDVSSAATGVNAAGTVVGLSMSADAQTRPFVHAGRMRFLGSLGGRYGSAAAINGLGQVVGQSRTAAGSNHAFLWTPSPGSRTSGSMVDLGVPRGRIATNATAISPGGLVVGGALDADYMGRAFLWTPSTPNGTRGRMVLLPLLAGGTFSGATGVNDRGEVIGNADLRGADRSFVYRNGRLRVLPLLPGGTHSFALGITRDGVVVGYADDATGDRAVAWVDGAIVDLNTRLPASVRRAGVVLMVAYAVSDCGAVVGSASQPDGHGHGFLLTGAL